jgi:hypothetical protein
MGLPAWDRAKFILALHILEERHHPPDLCDDGGLQAAGVVVRDEPTQPFVNDVSDDHEVR